MDIISAKVEAAQQSKRSGKKVYIIADEDGECTLNNAPLKGTIAVYSNGSEVEPEAETSSPAQSPKPDKEEKKSPVKKEMEKKSAPVKKGTAKKAVKKVATKKVAAKKSSGNKFEGGKKVDISIKDMLAKTKKGFYYRDPQGVRQSEAYLAGRTNQEYVREGMYEFAPSK